MFQYVVYNSSSQFNSHYSDVLILPLIMIMIIVQDWYIQIIATVHK